ncbi:MAG: peptide ABC transporter substrate-binding protein [Fimbriimonadaceae bacterium]
MKIELVGVGLAFGLLGCGQGFASRTTSQVNLVTVYSTMPTTMDPADSQDINTNDLLSQVYEGLTSWGEDNKLAPNLAQSWEVLDGGKRYRFHLRPGVKFSNGKELTAEDVRWSWERSCDSYWGSPLALNYLGDIVGVKEKLSGKVKTISGIKVINILSIDVVLDRPRAYFLAKLSYPTTYVMARDATKPRQRVLKPEAMIGTGPFVVTRFEQDQELQLVPNQHARVKPSIEKWTIKVVKDPATRLNLFRKGELDVLSLSQQDVAGVQASGHPIIEADRAATVYIGMNGTIYKPFADARVRRAFMMAVDRQFILDKILRGAGRLADGILPPAVPMPPRKKPTPQFDPTGARELLKQSNWLGKLPPIELWVNNSNNDRKTIAEYVVGQISKYLGVDAKLRLAESGLIISKATKRELGFYYGSWYADYLDPENFLSVLLADYGQNRSNYDNEAFSDLTRRGDAESDPIKRAALYAQAEDIALVDCPLMPLYHPQEPIVIREGVTGLRQNAFGFLPPLTVSAPR